MSLPKHVGDRLQCTMFPLNGNPQPLSEANEERESVLSIGIQSPATNTEPVFIGTEQQQLWRLRPGGEMTLNISKLSVVWVKGTNGESVVLLVLRTTGEASRAPGA
jgi:hypothetical protein